MFRIHAYGFSRWVMDSFILELEISKLKKKRIECYAFIINDMPCQAIIIKYTWLPNLFFPLKNPFLKFNWISNDKMH
jgi:hypothetical protein